MPPRDTWSLLSSQRAPPITLTDRQVAFDQGQQCSPPVLFAARWYHARAVYFLVTRMPSLIASVEKWVAGSPGLEPVSTAAILASLPVLVLPMMLPVPVRHLGPFWRAADETFRAADAGLSVGIAIGAARNRAEAIIGCCRPCDALSESSVRALLAGERRARVPVGLICLVSQTWIEGDH